MKIRWLSVMVLAVVLLCVVCLSVPADAAVDYATVNAPIDFATSTTQVCPVCGGSAVEWKPLPTITANTALAGGHYYLASDVTNKGGFTTSKTVTYCLHLNGYTLKDNSGAYRGLFYLTNSATLNIMGNGSITGGRVSAVATGTVNLYGGKIHNTTNTTFLTDSANANINVYPGADVCSIGITKGTLTIYGGRIRSLTVSSSAKTVKVSGAPYIDSLTISGGRTLNIGTLSDGARLNLAASSTGFNLTGNAESALANGYVSAGSIGGTVTQADDGTYSVSVPETVVHKVDCPHCEGTDLVDFTLWNGTTQLTTSGHYYMNKSVDYSKNALFLGDGSTSPDVVLDLNGFVLSPSMRLQLRNQTTLSVMDSQNGGAIWATASSDGIYDGALFSMMGNAKLNLYSGTLCETPTAELRQYKSGLIYLSAANNKVNVYGGKIIGGNHGKNTSGNGGAIYMVNGTLTMEGGEIVGGTVAENGGAVYMGTGTIDMNGGTISGGTAKNGGAIYMEDGKINIKGGSISGGTATGTTNSTGGGAIYMAKGTVDMTGGTISGGKSKYAGNVFAAGGNFNMNSGEGANGEITSGTVTSGTATTHGGNFYITSGKLNLSAGTITSGTSTSNGGNVYLGSTVSKLTMTGGTITGGTANGSGSEIYGGGNVYVNNGNFVMQSGTVSNGSALNGYGGNIFTRAGIYKAGNGVTIADDPATDAPKPVITGGQSKNTGGNILVRGGANEGVDTYAPLTLGSCEISSGDSINNDYGDDISVQNLGKLVIQSTFDAEADVYIPALRLPINIPGGAIEAGTGVAEGPFPGILRLEQYDEGYILSGKLNDTRLYVCDTGILTKDGEYIWLNNNDAIVDAAKDYEDCILRVTPGDLNLDGGDYLVDLRGGDVNITGTGNVTLIDSTNDSFETYGTAKIADGSSATVQTGLIPHGANTYFVINEEGTYSPHRIVNKLIGANLRPSIGGIYFTAQWECDTKLQEYLGEFGVAVSIQTMPEADFATDGHSKYSWFGANEFESGIQENGVIITGILKDTNQNRIDKNSDYAQMPIYAVPYINVDGECIVGVGTSFSLYDALNFLNTRINDYYKNAEALQSFMANWGAKGLDGDPWSSFTFEPSADAVMLHEAYAGTTAYHGEFHDHADTGGTSDGKATLPQIKEVMEIKGMDFTALYDHRQILHMDLADWDDTLFIGGTEMATRITDVEATDDEGGNNAPHVNMIFSSSEDFVNFATETTFGTNHQWALDANGEYHYQYSKAYTKAAFAELIENIKAYGGMYVFPHPEDGTRYVTDNKEDFWFTDWVGFEVFIGSSYAPAKASSQRSYATWKELLSMGKKMWATAGSDSHSLPNTSALTTIFSEQKHAVNYLNHAKVGDMTCGPIGIRICVGDPTGTDVTRTGGETDFTGKRLSICVSDFHESAVFDGHNYKVVLVTGKDGAETSQDIGYAVPGETFYYAIDADATCDYYRVEVYDENDSRLEGTGMPTAIGNPIWNTAAES